MKCQFLAILAVLLSFGIATPLIEKQSSNCRNFTISVPISAYNAPESQIPTSLSEETLTAFVSALGEIVFSDLVTGTYDTSVIYCEPQGYNATREKTLQFFVHGATYTKGYWFGDYVDNAYSWADYASKEGYPVLAIDRLGNGGSAHPNSIVDVQYPAQLSQIHNVIQMARYGKIPTVPAFEKIIYIGHSYGSIIGNALNRVYPHDVDATILTGFSCFFLTILPAVLAQSLLLPARIDEPSRYGNLDLGYLEFSNQGEFNYIFYYPEGSDENFANYDFSIRGTMTLGELASLVATGNTATGYTNPVLVASGQYDYLLCNELGFDLEPIVSPSCYDVPLVNILTGQNYLQGVADYYPDADFEWYVVPDAGHCWQFHYSAYEAFGDMHKWMASKGF